MGGGGVAYPHSLRTLRLFMRILQVSGGMKGQKRSILTHTINFGIYTADAIK